MANITNKQIIDHVKTMTALQLKELVELIENTFGVKAASGSSTPVVAVVDTKPTTVSLILSAVGDNKVGVIKAVKSILGADASLITAKKEVDKVVNGPVTLLENLDSAKATEFKEILKTAGATVTIK